MTSRAEFSRKIKVQAFTRAAGACEECGARLVPGKYEYDHAVPCALGGKAELQNCVVLCRECHGGKSGGRDVPQIRKADRQKASHLGAKARKGRPMPGTKASGIRKRMDGRVERRDG